MKRRMTARIALVLAVVWALVGGAAAGTGRAAAQTITEIIDSTGDGAGNVLDRPVGIAVDAAGNVYVAASNNDSAFKITPAGVITAIIDCTGDGTGICDFFPPRAMSLLSLSASPLTLRAMST